MSSAAARRAWNEAMKATAGSALPPSMQRPTTKRRSSRNNIKQERRVRARRVNTNDSSNDEYRAAVWMDALEGVDLAATVEIDEEFDELEELQGGPKKSKKRAKAQKAGVIPKRFLPKSLAIILAEEANKEGGAARDFLNAEARLPMNQILPARKFCPVTGLEGIYREPRSDIHYANMAALEQIRERSPPWMSLTGSIAFHEAVKSIRDE